MPPARIEDFILWQALRGANENCEKPWRKNRNRGGEAAVPVLAVTYRNLC